MSEGRCEDSSAHNELSQQMQPATRPLRVITDYPNVESSMHSPGRPTSLGLCIDSPTLKCTPHNNYTQDCSSQTWNIKTEDTTDLDKFLGQLNNNGSTPVTPTSFLNPNNITEDQERFADNFSRTLNKVKAEQEGLAKISTTTSGTESMALPLVSKRGLCCDGQGQQQSSVLDSSTNGAETNEELPISHLVPGSTSDQPLPIGLHQGSSVPNSNLSCITSAFLTGDPLLLFTTSCNTCTTTTPSSTTTNRKLIDINTSVGLQDPTTFDITGKLSDNSCTIVLEDLPDPGVYGQGLVALPPATTANLMGSPEPQWTAGLPTILSIATNLKGSTTICSSNDNSVSVLQPTYNDIPRSNFSEPVFNGCRVVQTQSVLSDKITQSSFASHDRSDNRLSTAFLVTASASTATNSSTLLHKPTCSPSDLLQYTPTSSDGGGSRYRRYHCTPETTRDSMGGSAITTVCSSYATLDNALSLDLEVDSTGQKKPSVLAAPITVLLARSPPLLSSQSDAGTQKTTASTGPARCSSVASAPADICTGSLLSADPLCIQQQPQQHICHQVYPGDAGYTLKAGLTSTVAALPLATLATTNGSPATMDNRCTDAVFMHHTHCTDVNNTDPLIRGLRFMPSSNPTSSFHSLASGGMLVSNGFTDSQLSELLAPLVHPTASVQQRTTDTNTVLNVTSGNDASSIMMDDRVSLSGTSLTPLNTISQQCVRATSMVVQSLPTPTKRNRRVSGAPVSNKQRFRPAPFHIDETYQMFDSQLSSTGVIGDPAHQSYYTPVRGIVSSNQTSLELSTGDNKLLSDTLKAGDGSMEECRGLQLTTPPSSLDGSGEKDELKLERKRARNRVAARRCRERKISLIRSLENQVAERDAHVRSLEATLARYRVEGERLRDHFEQLASSYPNLKVEFCKFGFFPKSDASS